MPLYQNLVKQFTQNSLIQAAQMCADCCMPTMQVYFKSQFQILSSNLNHYIHQIINQSADQPQQSQNLWHTCLKSAYLVERESREYNWKSFLLDVQSQIHQRQEGIKLDQDKTSIINQPKVDPKIDAALIKIYHSAKDIVLKRKADEKQKIDEALIGFRETAQKFLGEMRFRKYHLTYRASNIICQYAVNILAEILKMHTSQDFSLAVLNKQDFIAYVYQEFHKQAENIKQVLITLAQHKNVEIEKNKKATLHYLALWKQLTGTTFQYLDKQEQGQQITKSKINHKKKVVEDAPKTQVHDTNQNQNIAQQRIQHLQEELKNIKLLLTKLNLTEIGVQKNERIRTEIRNQQNRDEIKRLRRRNYCQE